MDSSISSWLPAVDTTSIWENFEEEGSDPFWAAVDRLKGAAEQCAMNGGSPHPALLDEAGVARMRAEGAHMRRMGLSMRALTTCLTARRQ